MLCTILDEKGEERIRLKSFETELEKLKEDSDHIVNIVQLYYESVASKLFNDEREFTEQMREILAENYVIQALLDHDEEHLTYDLGMIYDYLEQRKAHGSFKSLFLTLKKDDSNILNDGLDFIYRLPKRFTNTGPYIHHKNCKIETINSVEHAISLLSEENLVKTDKKNTGKDDRRSYFFRGHECITFKSIPSVLRCENYYKKESQLYTELQTVSPKDFQSLKKHFEILAEMQHYSLPTRLLDITSNRLAALFFATTVTDIRNKAYDGEIIVFSAHKNSIKTFSSDTVEIQNSFAFLPFLVKEKIHAVAKDVMAKWDDTRDQIRLFCHDDDVKRLLHEASKSGFTYSDSLNPDDLFKMFVCLPLQNNQRITNQSGAFISYAFLNKDIFRKKIDNEQSDYIKKIRGMFSFEEKDDEGNSIKIRFIIPYKAKTKIKKQLEELGINKGNIYPDLEKRSAYIKEKYLE